MYECVIEDGFDGLILSMFDRFKQILDTNSSKKSMKFGLPSETNGNIFPDALIDKFIGDHGEASITYRFSDDNNDIIPCEVSVSGATAEVAYYWTHPMFREARIDNYGYGVGIFEPSCSTNEQRWAETETIDDILDKVDAILAGRPHDGKVVMVFDFAEETMNTLRKLAVDTTRSLDECVEYILKLAIEKVDKKAFPDGFDQLVPDIDDD